MIEPKVTLIDYTVDAVDKLIYTKSTRLEQGEDTRNMVKSMTYSEQQTELAYMANTIPSSWEFINYTFEIKNVTRAFTHQFVRTRTGSYAQQTMRMLEKKNFTYRVPHCLKEETDKTLNVGDIDRAMAYKRYTDCMHEIQKSYNRMIELGIPAEDARGVLPTNIHTNIIAQFNLRTLSDMAKSRTGKRTQDEYREVFEQMFESVIEIHPWAEKFMFQDKRVHCDKIGNLIDQLHKEGNLDDTEYYDHHKALDKLRK